MRRSHGLFLFFGAFLWLGLSSAATNSFAADANFLLSGSAASCSSPLTPITDGCRLLIAGTYTDIHGNNFTIQDASSSNQARIEFIEGLVDKLILSGVVILSTQTNTEITINFQHQYASTKLNETNIARNQTSGGFALKFPNSTARTVTGTGFVELCTNSPTVCQSDPGPFIPSGPGGNQFSTLQGQITSPRTFGSFAVGPEDAPQSAPGFVSNALLRGQVVISSLKTGEKVTNLTHTLLVANSSNLPPFQDPTSSKCATTDDIGRIVRGTAFDGSKDTICVLREEGLVLMPGPEALSFAGSGFPLSIEEQIDGLKKEDQIIKTLEKGKLKK